ncbi:MAG: MerR family transcriptional regulator [Pseudomonadota bacterium]
MASRKAFRIGEVAARTGLTERMIRHYEKLGLVQPDRSDAGKRLYGANALSRPRHRGAWAQRAGNREHWPLPHGRDTAARVSYRFGERANPFSGGTDTPLTKLFLSSIAGVAVTVPLVVMGAKAGDPLILVLGMAVLAGLVWIPYGWAADDPVGMQHAVGRSIGCYLAYAFTPAPYRATAICTVVAAAYVYSLIQMRR